MIHNIENNGIAILINIVHTPNERYLEFLQANSVKRRYVYDSHLMAVNKEVFEISTIETDLDPNGDPIGATTRQQKYRIDDGSYNQLRNLTDTVGYEESTTRRAINGLLAMIFGIDFYAFNPIDSLNPIQPIEFTLSEETAPTEGNSDGKIAATITDGSGSYDYSIDGGTTWGTATKLNNLAAGEHNVSIRDKDVVNAWVRTKSITLVNA